MPAAKHKPSEDSKPASEAATSAPKRQKQTETTQLKKYPACHTIYVKNLNDKIAQPKMVQNLYILFSTYCNVLKVYHGKYRGQAWLTVESIDDAEHAIKNLNGLTVFGKKLDMSFAAQESHLF